MMDEYLKAKRSGDRAFRKAVLEGKYPYLASLDEIVNTASLTISVPFQASVPLIQIAGTKTAARANSFACNFMPVMDKDTEFAYKWSNLYDYQTEHGVNDAVSLYEYRHQFYVLEGNKRVSVFRYLKMPTMMAEVKRIMPAEEDEVYEEFLTFYKNAPLYEPYFTEAGKYRKLVKLCGKTWNEKWDDVAVSALRSRWYRFAASYADDDTDPENLSEAFLLYLSVYGYETLKTDSKAVIDKNITLLHKELDAGKEDADIALVETPPEKKDDRLLNIIPKLAPVPKLKVSFIYDALPSESSEVFEHETGRIILENICRDTVETKAYEDCDTKEKLREALKNASVSSDAVFTVSPLQMEETLRFAIRYPGVKYLNCSVNKKVSAVRSYAVRMYETSFLMGAAAACMAENHKAAYIADVPVYGTVSEINAFAIGASLIDPKIQIFLDWNGVLGSDWKEQMQRLGITTFCVDDTLGKSAASTEYGLFQLDGDGSVRNLAAPVIHWAEYYRIIARLIRDGGWNMKDAGGKYVNYWWGMQAGVLDIHLSGSLPYQVRKMVTMLKDSMMRGTLDPFQGELHSREGLVRSAYAEKLSSGDIISMDWLNDNVIGAIPGFGALKNDAKDLAEESGIPAARPKGETS